MRVARFQSIGCRQAGRYGFGGDGARVNTIGGQHRLDLVPGGVNVLSTGELPELSGV